MTETLVVPRASEQHENLGLVLILIIGGGLLIGALLLVISYRYELIGLTALVPGLAAFALMCYAIWQGHVRGRAFSLILGLILSLLIYGSYQAMRYVTVRRTFIAAYEVRNPSAPGEADRMVDQMLVQETGASGFLGYVRYQLKYGMSISATNPLMGPSNQVTGPSVLFYWLYDAVTILVGALTGAWWANNRAYCEHCHTYYGRIKSSGGDMGLQKIGWLESNTSDEFKRLLEVGHFEQAGTMLQSKQPRQKALEVKIERCDTCTTSPVILSAYRGKTFWNSRQGLQFRLGMNADDYDRLTTFATLGSPKHRLSSTNEWVISVTFVVLFLAGLMWAYGALQNGFQ